MLGEEVANELVNWFNAVDATYRADLREFNDLNFARFDARLEQRLAHVDARFAELEAHFAALEARFDAKLAELKSDLIKWTFVFWAPTALAVVGLLLRR